MVFSISKAHVVSYCYINYLLACAILSLNNETFRYIFNIIHVMCSEIILKRLFQQLHNNYEGWNFNSGNYLFTTDTK